MDIKQITKRIKELDGQDKDRAFIKGTLLIEGAKEADINKAFKEAGLTRTQSGFRHELYEVLQKGPVTKAAFEKLMDGQSDNVLKHKSHFEAIVEMANAIWKTSSK